MTWRYFQRKLKADSLTPIGYNLCADMRRKQKESGMCKSTDQLKVEEIWLSPQIG